MSHKAQDVHHNFASNLAYENTILWDAYTPRQFPLFREKLKQLFRDPSTELSTQNDANNTTPQPNRAMEKIREAVYKSTISQTKYTNKILLSTFILVTVAEGSTFSEAKNATKFSIHLIVRTRKCMVNDDSTNCCMVFIDEMGNVYKNWKHFQETNSLPAGVALAPEIGVYKFEDNKLNLDSWETPANKTMSHITSTTDTVAAVGGVVSAVVTLTVAAAPVAAAAGVVCAATGLYSASRSVYNLWSRNDHEQSISLTDSTARSSWLGVASGALSLGSAAATKSLANVVAAGKEVTLFRSTVVNGMNISTMLLSGTGVANGIFDLIVKYLDDEEISNLDVLQVAASLAIFTHSAYNFRLASTIVNQTQDSKLNSYKSELSSRQRKMFEKMTKETVRIKGGTNGKMDVIRLINEVPDKQYLNDLHKVNKNLNKNNIRFSAGQDGHVKLNNDISVKPVELRSNIQQNQGNLLGSVNQPIPQSHQSIPNQNAVNTLASNAFSENSAYLVSYCQKTFQVAGHLIFNGDTLQNCVQNMIRHIGDQVTQFLIEKTKQFFDMYRQIVENYIRTSLYIENVLFDMYTKVVDNLEVITIETIEGSIQLIFDLLLKHYNSMSVTNNSTEQKKCDFCNGFYTICSI